MRRPVSLSLILLATAALGLSACKRVEAPAAEAAATTEQRTALLLLLRLPRRAPWPHARSG